MRVDKVLDPLPGDSGPGAGKSVLGVVERGRCKPGTDAIFDLERSRKPDVEGVRKVPSARPRAGVPSRGGTCGLKGFDKSWRGPELDPGLLSEGGLDGVALSFLRLEPGREQRLAGLEADLYGSGSKKFEFEALLLKAGDEGSRDRVCTVRSANDGRGFKVLARMVSSPAISLSSSIGLVWETESLDA